MNKLLVFTGSRFLLRDWRECAVRRVALTVPPWRDRGDMLKISCPLRT